jgi:hypothetical protein
LIRLDIACFNIVICYLGIHYFIFTTYWKKFINDIVYFDLFIILHLGTKGRFICQIQSSSPSQFNGPKIIRQLNLFMYNGCRMFISFR